MSYKFFVYKYDCNLILSQNKNTKTRYLAGLLV